MDDGLIMYVMNIQYIIDPLSIIPLFIMIMEPSIIHHSIIHHILTLTQ